MDAAPDVDGAEQLQALGERRGFQIPAVFPETGGFPTSFVRNKLRLGTFFAQTTAPGGEVFILTLPKEILETNVARIKSQILEP